MVTAVEGEGDTEEVQVEVAIVGSGAEE